jgi:hypothetical protein
MLCKEAGPQCGCLGIAAWAPTPSMGAALGQAGQGQEMGMQAGTQVGSMEATGTQCAWRVGRPWRGQQDTIRSSLHTME